MTSDNYAIITNQKALMHYQPFPKPNLESFETPLRVQMAEAHLRTQGILTDEVSVNATSARDDDVLLVHSPYLLDTVRLMSGLGSGELGEAAYASPDLLRSALVTVGGAIKAAEMASTGKPRHSFVLMRPPGHHASTSNPMGLCYFNNVAIAVRHIMKRNGVKRVSILDFDDHHGNGTSEIFYSDRDVQYISIHEYDYNNFGTGHYEELGYGEGLGTNINIPLIDGASDETYRVAIEEIVVPAIQHHQPQVIALSAGYDAHFADPVGNMNIDTSTYWYIGKTIEQLVGSTGASGSFWVLEGGYNPFMIGPSIEASIEGFLGRELPKMDDQIPREVEDSITEANLEVVERVVELLKEFW